MARLRERWPQVAIEMRAGAGFARPEIYAFCEANAVACTIGLVTNPQLECLAEPILGEALAASAQIGGAKVRLVREATYQAESWPTPRRIIIKAETLMRGEDGARCFVLPCVAAAIVTE